MNFTEWHARGGDIVAMEERIIGSTTEEAEGLGFAKNALSRPLIYVDEDYFGTMHIDKRMNLTTNLNIDDESVNYGWLPCACNGWDNMDLPDKRGHSADGIFDCSCLNIPNKAEYPK